jgi:hypothetical protein
MVGNIGVGVQQGIISMPGMKPCMQLLYEVCCKPLVLRQPVLNLGETDAHTSQAQVDAAAYNLQSTMDAANTR